MHEAVGNNMITFQFFLHFFSSFVIVSKLVMDTFVAGMVLGNGVMERLLLENLPIL